MTPSLEKRFDEIESLAREMGLDFFPVVFEEVPREIIWDIASYGLPTRMSHWSFGRSYIHQKTYGEMGYSKIYELILNNDPSYAFLDDTNSDVVNMLICAHCIAHSSFFKHNGCFATSNRNMVNQAERNAKVIDEYKTKYGTDVVEDWMDIAFAIDRHIDPRLGENRRKYPEPEHVFREINPLPYAELFGETIKPNVVEEVKNTEFPPHPEYDLLWFIATYAQMLPWQREVLSIIRSESFYFYPQMLTKIMNEGWASFWHAELMLNYDNRNGRQGLSPAEHLDFSKAHSGVVSPGHGGSLNPYYVGFRIFTDIKERWDEYFEAGKKDAAFQRSSAIDGYDDDLAVVMSKKTGHQKMFEVMAEDDDVSFIYNYLTRELAEDMKLFTYGYRGKADDPEEDDIIIKDRELEKVRQVMTAPLHNYGAPPIFVVKANDKGLILKHDERDTAPLDEQYAKETLKYIFQAWRKPVKLYTRDRFGGSLEYAYSEAGSAKKDKSNEDGSMSIEIEI
jgi:stage V sporulation protein R